MEMMKLLVRELGVGVMPGQTRHAVVGGDLASHPEVAVTP